MAAPHKKGTDIRRKAPITHRDVCRAVGKIGAYLRIGQREKASEWAVRLVSYLDKMELLPRRDTDE